MGNLADQLLKVGLASKEQHRQMIREISNRADAQFAKQKSQLTSRHNRPTSLDRIQACETIVEFKAAAKDLLLAHPELIANVVTEAHRFKGQEGGKKLVWLVLNVREKLKITPMETRGQFLKRAFRRHGSILETPVED